MVTTGGDLISEDAEVPEMSEKDKEIARLRAAEKFMVKETGVF